MKENYFFDDLIRSQLVWHTPSASMVFFEVHIVLLAGNELYINNKYDYIFKFVGFQSD